jgi:hypothetical protein
MSPWSLHIGLLSLVVLVGTALAARADPAVFTNGRERPPTFVTDPENVLGNGVRLAMEEQLRDLAQTHSAEVIVVIVPAVTETSQENASEWLTAWNRREFSILVLIDREGNLVIIHRGVDREYLGGAPINLLLSCHVALADRIGSPDTKIRFIVDKFCGELQFLSLRAKKVVVDTNTAGVFRIHDRRMRMIIRGASGLVIAAAILDLLLWFFDRRPRRFSRFRISRRFGARSCAAGVQYVRHD